MKFHILALGAALSGAAIAPVAADPLPMDSPVTMGSVETVCTGIGSAKDDPKWSTYPIRVEFSNGAAQYLSGAHVKLADAAGKTLAEFDCSGAWVLFKLPRGSYKVAASMTPDTNVRSATFSPPEHGQKRVVLQFPGMQANQ
jgi:hypothetical protein